MTEEQVLSVCLCLVGVIGIIPFILSIMDYHQWRKESAAKNKREVQLMIQEVEAKNELLLEALKQLRGRR